MFFPWSFEKLFELIIVQTTLLKPNRPLTLSFFFKEVVNIKLLLLYQLFEQLAIVDVSPLSTATTDAIADPLFGLIGMRTDTRDAKQ